jgi:spore germination cell wall hydrolase CwlJ-like protein
MGMMVSFTADAGQEPSVGVSLALLNARPIAAPADLVPTGDGLGAPIPFGIGYLPSGDIIRRASLMIGGPANFQRTVDEVEPRREMKSANRAQPRVERARRTDPVVGLRPTFDAKLRKSGSLADARQSEIMLGHEDSGLVDSFAPGEIAAIESVSTFEPWAEGEAPTTLPQAGATPAGQGASALTMRPAAKTERLLQGATPAVPRAVALSSTTPQAPDAAPVEVVALAALPRAMSGTGKAARMTIAPRQNERPDYASLVDPDNEARERRCLAEAVYFEARSEPESGQAAVAQVVLNRVKSGLYPSSICGVVYQNRHRHLACQFTFACEGKSLRITEPGPWATAVRIANQVMGGQTYLSDVGGSTHYHANYVRPRWAKYLKKMDRIGHHIFYQLRPGQT